MTLDTRVRRAVKRVMEKIGTEVTLRRVAIGTYNPATGTLTNAEEDVTVKGRLDEYDDRELRDTIKAGDRKLTVAAADLTFLPVVNDQVLIGTDAFRIMRVRREMVQNEPGLYVLQIRG